MMEQTAGRAALRNLSWAVVWIVVLVAAVMARIDQHALQRPFGTDEADYVRALSLGLQANYLGTAERSGVTFLRQVVAEYRATGWARPFEQDWQQRDAAGLRHYHPPLGLYPVATLARAGVRDERTLRLIPVAIGVLSCLGAAWLASVMAPGRSQPIAALIAGLLVAASPYHIAASTELSFHAAFELLSTLALVSLVMTIRTGHTGWWYAASAMLGLTLLTVPYWLVVVPAYLWVGWFTVRRQAGPIRASAGLAVVVATVLVAWPPFLTSAAFVKPALMYGGIVLKPLPGSATATSWVVRLAATHWLTLGCLVAGLVGLMVKRLGVASVLIPAVLFCSGFALVNARVTHMKPLYAADLIPPLSALAAAAIVTWGSIVPALVAATALGVSVQTLVSARARDQLPTWRSEMEALSRTVEDARVLVTPRPAGAMVAYYAGCEVVLDSAEATDVAALRAAAARGEIDIVLQWGPRPEPGGVARELAGSLPHETFTIEQNRVQLTRLTPRPAPQDPALPRR